MDKNKLCVGAEYEMNSSTLEDFLVQEFEINDQNNSIVSLKTTSLPSQSKIKNKHSRPPPTTTGSKVFEMSTRNSKIQTTDGELNLFNKSHFLIVLSFYLCKSIYS